MMTKERAAERQEGFEETSMDSRGLYSTFTMSATESNGFKAEEEGKDSIDEPLESWRDEEPTVEEALESPADALPAVLSSPEAAPSVTSARKSELLLQARADRITWIQAVPLPYEISDTHSTDNDPWSHDDRLALLKNSNAVQSLPCLAKVLSSLYGMEQSTSIDVADRIQTMVSLPVHTSFLAFALLSCVSCSWNHWALAARTVNLQPHRLQSNLWQLKYRMHQTNNNRHY